MKRVLTVMLASTLMVGCGLQKTTEDTLQQVKETNNKTGEMVTTTSDMKELTKQLLAATANLKDLTSQLLTKTGNLDELTSKVQQQTAQLVELTKQLNGGMDKTNDGIRLQTLTLSLQTLLADVNTQSLTPPAMMLPAAEKFSEVATPFELTQVYYTYLTDAQVGLHDAAGLRAQARLKSYRAASALVGMAPDAKIAQILHDQIEQHGRYEGTAYALMASRYVFIRNYRFQPLLDEERTPVVNEAVVREAVTFFNSLKMVAQAPNATTKFTVTIPQVVPDPNGTGHDDKYIDLTENVADGELKDLGDSAVDAFKSRLTKQQLESQTIQDLLHQLSL